MLTTLTVVFEDVDAWIFVFAPFGVAILNLSLFVPNVVGADVA
jgi:hypothetical protein